MTDVFALDSEVDTGDLRRVLGKFTTGVVIVTTMTDTGPIGMTVNSFCSVSLTPPVVLFCVRHGSQLHPPFATATAFAINILDSDQQELANQFARPGLNRFGSVRWRPGMTRSPVVRGGHALLECLTDRVFTAGDHDIVLGRVVHAHSAETGGPLMYYSGGYHRL
jgi:flavin reductase (DIM6/NTAB) family NADH-FMN oxidoreductase RutF